MKKLILGLALFFSLSFISILADYGDNIITDTTVDLDYAFSNRFDTNTFVNNSNYMWVDFDNTLWSWGSGDVLASTVLRLYDTGSSSYIFSQNDLSIEEMPCVTNMYQYGVNAVVFDIDCLNDFYQSLTIIGGPITSEFSPYQFDIFVNRPYFISSNDWYNNNEGQAIIESLQVYYGPDPQELMPLYDPDISIYDWGIDFIEYEIYNPNNKPVTFNYTLTQSNDPTNFVNGTVTYSNVTAEDNFYLELTDLYMNTEYVLEGYFSDDLYLTRDPSDVVMIFFTTDDLINMLEAYVSIYSKTSNSLVLDIVNNNSFDVFYTVDVYLKDTVLPSTPLYTENGTLLSNDFELVDVIGLDPYTEYDVIVTFRYVLDTNYITISYDTFITDAEPATVYLSFNENRGSVLVDGDPWVTGTFSLTTNDTFIIEAIPNVDHNFIYYDIYSDAFGHIVMMDPILELTLLPPETTIYINAIFSAPQHPGYYSYTYSINEPMTTYFQPPDVYFTWDGFQRAYIYINNQLIVQNGELLNDDYIYMAPFPSDNEEYFFASLSCKDINICGDGMIMFLYEDNFVFGDKGTVRISTYFDTNSFTYPATLELFLPTDSIYSDTNPYIPPGDVNAPNALLSLLANYGLYNTEGLFLFTAIIMILVIFGGLALNLGSGLVIMIASIIGLLFIFMAFLPLWGSILVITIILFSFIKILKGSEV